MFQRICVIISVLVFVVWVCCFLVAVVHSGSLTNVVVVGSLVESASACWWVSTINGN